MSGEFNEGREAIAQGEKLKKFYQLVSSEYPEGFPGSQRSFPVNIGGREFKAVLFGEMEEGKVSVGVFIEGTRYARKTLEIDPDGNVAEDTVGVIPQFDITDNEPDFSGMSNEQLAEVVIDAMQLESGKQGQQDRQPQTEKTETKGLSLEQRLSQRDPHLKIGVVSNNPEIGQVTADEVSSLDPEIGDGSDFASVVLISIYINDGKFNKQQFIREVSGIDDYEGEADEDKPSASELQSYTDRATQAVNKMLELGLLEEKSGKIYSNVELMRK